MSSPSSASSAQRALLQQTTAYIDQLPIFTRVAAVLMVVCEVISLLPGWDIKAWGRLEVDNFSSQYSLWQLGMCLAHCWDTDKTQCAGQTPTPSFTWMCSIWSSI
jgi:hypothetical protein